MNEGNTFISLQLPSDLLAKVDEAAAQAMTSRAAWMRQALSDQVEAKRRVEGGEK